ncbi:Mitochondrial fusion and transport protein UGO1 [Candida viswanathii]|uniref:Mitochondrial fusion and transport protein UGO1 n=1 Tax=Candida viswanathii TaxID=5486 RepID=A0A367YHT2_9ASCO|nr:Mitochondrial fusion and transport protein UGO1 [Candida viswanathii]
MSSSSPPPPATPSHLDTQTLRPYYDHDTFNAGYPVIFKKGVGIIDPKTNKPITSNISDKLIDQNLDKNQGLLGRLFKHGGPIGIKAGGDKNYVYDLEFNEYFESNNLIEVLKNLVWNFLKSYVKVLLAQPLEIVRLVLQVGRFKFTGGSASSKKTDLSRSRRLLTETDGDNETEATTTEHDDDYGADQDDDNDGNDYDDDEEPINYFQSQNEQQVWSGQDYDDVSNSRNLASSSTPALRHTKRSRHEHRKRMRINKIKPKSLHTIDIITAIVNKDGPLALFRGINASFIYQTLSHTIEAWITGFVSPFLGIPDPFFLDLTHSNDPFKSLWLSVTACVVTGIILMPLDLIRVKFMITQFNTKPLANDDIVEEAAEEIVQSTRSVRESIRNFPVYYLLHPPTPIVLLTTLHELSTSIFRKMAPYILFIKFNIDSYSAPNIYTFVNLISLILEFFIKLPVENLLRKEQVRFLLTPKKEDVKKVITIEDPQKNLIVEFNDLALDDEDMTLWEKFKQLGLFNGWRIGVMNVIGFWGYNIIKSNGSELKEERL